MSTFIEGIGTATPPHVITQEHAAEAAADHTADTPEQRRQLYALYRLSRVRTRHSVLLESSSVDGMPRQSFFPFRKDATDPGPSTAARMARYEADAGPLAVLAARAALADAAVGGSAITHLVTVSCTGFAAPGVDIRIVRELGLPASTPRAHVGFMGCHGALHALRVARSFTENSPDARVLVCAVEVCSIHFQYGWSPDLVVANALFADGAAAVVVSGRPRDGRAAWQVSASGSILFEDSADDMTWRIGDHGFAMTLSSRVPGAIQRSLGPWLHEWLRDQGLSMGDVATWAVHPGGPRILESCAQVTGSSRQDYVASHEVLAEFGNMSSPTILFIIDRLRRRNAPLPCVALGFGPGLTAEAALFR